MSAFWRLFKGTDPSRPDRERKKTTLRPQVSPLEGRQLMAVTMGVVVASGTKLLNGTTLTSNLVLPAVKVTPQVLFPADGAYVPVNVSGGVNSTYTMNLDGAYAVFPKPQYTAHVLAQLPLPDPTSTAPVQTGVPSTYTATPIGSKTPVTIPYTLDVYSPPQITSAATIAPGTGIGLVTVTLPGTKYPMTFGFLWTNGSVITNPNGTFSVSPNGTYQLSAKDLPVSDYEKLVIDARLNARKGPVDVVLQTTDQYRQDEPHIVSPLTQLAAPSVQPFGNNLTVFASPKDGIKYTEQIEIPTAYAIFRSYSYGFTIHLQAKKNTGTGGRQYILNVSSEDADDGGSVNTAVVVPSNA